MKSNIANNTFLKRKLDIVKRGEFEERLQIHMCQKASVYILVLRSWPPDKGQTTGLESA